MKQGKILVVDDNASIRTALKILLPMYFGEVRLLPSPVTLMAVVAEFRPDVVLLDMNFNSEANTGGEGLYWLSELKASHPAVRVVLFTAYADVALAVEGMKRGAFDFIVKPWENDKLVAVLQAAVLSGQRKPSKAAPSSSIMFWGEGEAMSQLRKTVSKIAPTDATVLITGENGTGKDLLAREVHEASLRRSAPMVGVDLGAVPGTLFESELFGHVKGSFTDAYADHTGKFEQASGGTIFLDEIGNVPLPEQAKLLRVLQSRSVTRVGDTKAIPVDVRLICATNCDLEAMVQRGDFREDLYYRINTMTLHLPALRERSQDIVPLAEIFLRRYAEKYRRHVVGISASAQKALLSHGWPGNIRELQNCIEKAVILSEGRELSPEDLLLPAASKGRAALAEEVGTLEEVEEKTIRAAMDKFSGNLSLVAKALDISRPTLYSKLKKYGI